jgi:hypothetical protein
MESILICGRLISMESNKKLVLKQTLPYPVSGYWDGGKKQIFHWSIEGSPGTDSKGQFIRIGSWAANHWFHVALGHTDKLALCNAKRHLQATKLGKQSVFEYVEE